MMKARWSSMLFMLGLALALSGLVGPGFAPRTAEATTTGCTPSSDLYNCDVSGTAGTFGLRVQQLASSGATRGITGIATSNGGAIGLNGVSTATTGTGIGVRGEADSNVGIGVFGYAPTSGNVNYGVQGQSASNGARGVYGYASNTSTGVTTLSQPG